MGAREIASLFMYHKWEFDSREELEAAIKKEAHFCGDSIKGDTIYNDHQCSVRWSGKVKE